MQSVVMEAPAYTYHILNINVTDMLPSELSI